MLLPSDRPNEVQQRFIDLKYGMFVHFGINTFINKGWSNGKVSPFFLPPDRNRYRRLGAKRPPSRF